MPCNFISISRCWVCALGQVLVAGFRLFFSTVCVFPFIFHHNPWTSLSLVEFPLYPSNPSPRHLIFYTCLHCFHQIIAVVTNFARIIPVLSSNSECIHKTGLVFAYELGIRRSIYQNRSKKNLDPSIPHLVRVEDFYFGQKVVTRSSFRGHKVFVDFEHVF